MVAASKIQNMLPQVLRNKYRQSLYWSTILTHSLLRNAGGSYVVLGHPKSGTNWLCGLLSSYFDIPVFQSWTRLMPAVRPQIFHMHRFLGSPMAKNRTFYIHRDGRDILISRYFAIMNSPWGNSERQKLEAWLEGPMSIENLKHQLPKYIDWNYTKSRSSSQNWQKHIDLYRKYPYVCVSFEGLKDDPVRELSQAIAKMTNDLADFEHIQAAINKNDIKKKKSKANAHFLRSGKSGDWKTYFSVVAAERFNAYAGRALISLGYEDDDKWVSHCN